MSQMLDIQRLTKRFGPLTAVDDVSFSVDRGEVLGFLGPNGAGKTTVMRMITGFLPPSSGTAVVCGFDVTKLPIEVKSRIGYVPEGAPLYEEMSPRGLLGFVAEIRGFSGRERDNAVARAAERINLGEVLDQPIGTLSKGFKRRVAVAQAILHDPEVLVLDEPTDGLDPNQKHEVRALIREMSENKVIVISTHLLEEVGAVCSRVIIISRGKLIADGTPESLEARSSLYNAVSIRVANDRADEIHAQLVQISGVATVNMIDRSAPIAHLMVLPKDGKPILPEVSAFIRQSDFPIEEIRAEQGHLEEVFRSMTMPGAETGAGADR
jgi:gliding motility-associated transport system ATP-binding protein